VDQVEARAFASRPLGREVDDIQIVAFIGDDETCFRQGTSPVSAPSECGV
jgi:hypothetical protein